MKDFTSFENSKLGADGKLVASFTSRFTVRRSLEITDLRLCLRRMIS
ncbi:MAG: hypothetical protein ACFNKL_03840 [Treponema sp.]